MKITNTLHYCANHLKAVSYTEEENDDGSISITSTHFTNLLFVFNNILFSLKKQTMLLQYVGQLLNAFEVPKFECFIL
ncbi:22246_t:CDS:2 [Cetraspora pellucida]|uniref:22246_t:CDS:1 n=1 Tax=Cetraspora pellucida TaxID=1433469 RepID=A0A9N9A3P3_9GLOM|nr:22246_t:CDS:2 [Cetraspora pellucida]